ncbi:MAG: hypothetical protein VX278_00435 [Myxococcota bacterium]|nr:hypothetical protein [Myxococcota bacterium]
MMLWIFQIGCFPSMEERNFPPHLEIISPNQESAYNEGELITVEAIVSDELLISGGISVSWSSNLNGLLHERIPNSDGLVVLSSVNLSPGQHQTTIRAEDAEGLSVELPLDLFVNASPSPPQISIVPENPSTRDTLSVQAVGSLDPEGSPVVLEYEWFQNNTPFTPENPAEISSEHTQKGQSWMVRVLATDGMAYAEPVVASTTISGLKPQMNDLEISPQNPSSDDLLLCTASAEDVDGDPISYEYHWQVVSNGTLQDVIYEGESLQLTPEEFKPGDKPTCFVRVFDEDGEGSASTFVGIENRSPVLETILIHPNTGVRPGEQLICSSTASDPDQQTLSSAYEWYRERPDGTTTLLSLNPTLELSTDNANKNDILRCVVHIQDELGMEISGQSEVLVVNTPPQITAIGMNPQSPSAQEPIECTVLAEDLDGDSFSVQYSWFLDGVLQTESSNVFSQPRLSSSTVECTASVSDAEDTGNSMSASVSIVNSPPVIHSLSITTPQTPTTNALLSAEIQASDIDDDSLIVYFDWYVDGLLVKTGLGATLSGEDHFDKNEEVIVVATADDGLNSSLSVASDPILIENTPPTQPEISLSSQFILEEEDIVCSIDVDSTDEDEDEITYQFQWYANGAPWTGSTSSTTQTGDSIDSALISVGDEWRCHVTATDATETVDSNEDTATIVSCPVQYEYSIIEDLADLENIHDCWSVGSNSTLDPYTFVPFPTVWHSEEDYFQYKASSYFILNKYNGSSTNGIMVSPLDGSHETVHTLYGYFSLASNWVLHNPDVVKINVGNQNNYTFLQWAAPTDNTCTLDFTVLPVSGFYQPYFYHYVNNTVSLYHNETELENHLVQGYNNNPVNIALDVDIMADDILTFVFHPNTSDSNVDWIQITGSIRCPY